MQLHVTAIFSFVFSGLLHCTHYRFAFSVLKGILCTFSIPIFVHFRVLAIIVCLHSVKK